MSWVEGQDRAVTWLRHACTSDRLGHALLFVGPNGVGRERMALGLAGWLLCQSPISARPTPFGCGTCHSCKRIYHSPVLRHPDVHLLLTQQEQVKRNLRQENDGDKKPSTDILIEQVRDLRLALQKRAYEGGYKVAIIVDAHRMNTNAANALLKSLEEPTEKTLLILIAPHLRAVMGTLVSRCQRVLFQPLPQDVLATLLTRQGFADATLRSQQADGSLEIAKQLDVAHHSIPAEVEDILQAMYTTHAQTKLDVVDKFGKERERVIDFLRSAQRHLAFTLRAQAKLLQYDGASDFSWEKIHSAQMRLDRALRALDGNAQVPLVLESLFFASAA